MTSTDNRRIMRTSTIIKQLLAVALFLITLGVGLTSCNFLNIVPDGTASSEDAFKNPMAAKRYLYSCYGFIPSPSSGTGSMDFLGGDEVVTPFEHETPSKFNKGIYTSTDPILSYWNQLFEGIRYCYTLQQNVDKVPLMDKELAEDYKAQADFLIAYYHYLLIQNYGAVILIKDVEDTNAKVEDFKARTPLDECVAFVAEKFDAAAAKLPETREGDDYGLVTKAAAKAMKAKLLVMAASPLFNGYEGVKGLANPDGKLLFPQSFDQSKWDKAYAAAEDAVRTAEAAGHKLFVAKEGMFANVKEPQNLTQKTLRMSTLDKDISTETVWGDTRHQGNYDIQGKSAPWSHNASNNGNAWGGVAPTLAMMERFYTENGLPIREDPKFTPESQWWDLISVPAGYENAEGQIPNFLYKREPRLYAWTCFNNGFYEIGGKVDKSNYAAEYHRGNGGAKIVLKMQLNGASGRQAGEAQPRNNDYSPSGFLNKRLVHPLKTPSQFKYDNYIHPYVTLADLYLLLAEAAVEVGKIDVAKTYLDKVRTRAGVPTVDEAWKGAKHPEKAQTKEGMRDIVRQERQIEMYLLNQNFWDMRRWLLAEKYFSVHPYGMNIMTDDIALFNKPTELTEIRRSFVAPANYFMPFPQDEVNKNNNLVQNVGY